MVQWAIVHRGMLNKNGFKNSDWICLKTLIQILECAKKQMTIITVKHHMWEFNRVGFGHLYHSSYVLIRR